MKSTKWETRVTAARAFGGIVNHSELWDPNCSDTIKKSMNSKEKEETIVKIEELDEASRIKLEQDEELKKIDDNLSNLVDFNSWNLHEILKSNVKLLACGTDEFEPSNGTGQHPDDNSTFIGKLKKQKSNITPVEETEGKPDPEVKTEHIEAVSVSCDNSD